MGGICRMHGRMRNAQKRLVRKLEGKRSLRRPRHRWEDDIAIDLRVVVWEVVGWIHLNPYRDQ
jgi:hypothetical protein